MSPKHFEFGPFLKRVYCAAFLEFVIELFRIAVHWTNPNISLTCFMKSSSFPVNFKIGCLLATIVDHLLRETGHLILQLQAAMSAPRMSRWTSSSPLYPVPNLWLPEASVDTCEPSRQLRAIFTFQSELWRRWNCVLAHSTKFLALSLWANFPFDSIAIRVNVLSERVENWFAHDVTQFAVMASILSDQNEVALGF